MTCWRMPKWRVIPEFLLGIYIFVTVIVLAIIYGVTLGALNFECALGKLCGRAMEWIDRR